MKLDFVCLDADQAIMETGATSPAMHVNLDAIELQEMYWRLSGRNVWIFL